MIPVFVHEIPLAREHLGMLYQIMPCVRLLHTSVSLLCGIKNLTKLLISITVGVVVRMLQMTSFISFQCTLNTLSYKQHFL